MNELIKHILIISDNQASDITRQANELIKQGYQPLGSTQISKSDYTITYCLTMVKY